GDATCERPWRSLRVAALPARELVLDVGDVDTGDREQHVQVEEQVGRLLREASVACDGREGRLDRLFPELLRGPLDPGVRERGDVRAFRSIAHALDHRAPELRREAGAGTGVAGRPVGAHAQEQSVAVAVVAELFDMEDVARRL